MLDKTSPNEQAHIGRDRWRKLNMPGERNAEIVAYRERSKDQRLERGQRRDEIVLTALALVPQQTPFGAQFAFPAAPRPATQAIDTPTLATRLAT